MNAERKDNLPLDIVFPVVAGSIDLVTGLTEEAPMNNVHSLFSVLIGNLTYYRGNVDSSDPASASWVRA